MNQRRTQLEDAMQVDPMDDGPLSDDELGFMSKLLRQDIIYPIWEHIQDGTWPPTREKFILRFDWSWNRYDRITAQFVEMYVKPRVRLYSRISQCGC